MSSTDLVESLLYGAGGRKGRKSPKKEKGTVYLSFKRKADVGDHMLNERGMSHIHIQGPDQLPLGMKQLKIRLDELSKRAGTKKIQIKYSPTRSSKSTSGKRKMSLGSLNLEEGKVTTVDPIMKRISKELLRMLT